MFRAQKTWLDEYDLRKIKLEKKHERVLQREYKQEQLIEKKKEQANTAWKEKSCQYCYGFSRPNIFKDAEKI